MNAKIWVSMVVSALVAACSSTRAPMPLQAEVVQEVVLESTVQAVDAETREVTVFRQDGTRAVVAAGPEVRDFARIEVGDRIKVRYRESLSAVRLEAAETGPEPTVGMSVEQADEGGKPGIGIGAGVEVTVTVVSVDVRQRTVVLTGASGHLRRVRVRTDVGKRFLRGLRIGDRVKLVYSEAVAVRIEG